VIQQHRYIMTLMNILAHASTLRPKGRGINPVEIQAMRVANSPTPA
jgi:hemerythrin-like domain-containing protein